MRVVAPGFFESFESLPKNAARKQNEPHSSSRCGPFVSKRLLRQEARMPLGFVVSAASARANEKGSSFSKGKSFKKPSIPSVS